MKKILLTLLAAIAALSVEAQIIEVRRGTSTEAEAVYDQNYKVKFRAKKTTSELTGYVVNQDGKIGKCNRKKVEGESGTSDEVEQNWYQLWANGPKFATNVITNVENKEVQTDVSSKWGDNWRAPTLAELITMISTCEIGFSENKFTITGNGKTISIDAKPDYEDEGTYYIYLWSTFIATDQNGTTKRIATYIKHEEGTNSIRFIPTSVDKANILPILNE